jgi:hypothetical protein
MVWTGILAAVGRVRIGARNGDGGREPGQGRQ